jgi:hypothetical protein
MNESALGLQIPGSTDPPSPEPIAKNAEKADALAQAGGVAKRLWTPTAVTRTSATLGGLSTPIAVTLPEVEENQVIEILCLFFVKSTIETASGTGGKVGLEINGVAGAPTTIANLGEGGSALAANTYESMFTSRGGGWGYGHNSTSASPRKSVGLNLSPLTNTNAAPSTALYIAETALTNAVVELRASSTTGTITIANCFLAARVWG